MDMKELQLWSNRMVKILPQRWKLCIIPAWLERLEQELV